MAALQLTTLPANGQHLAVPTAIQSREQWKQSRLAAQELGEGTGMAERVVC